MPEHNTIINDIIASVKKHHNQEMSPKCVEEILNILKNHCPHYNQNKQ